MNPCEILENWKMLPSKRFEGIKELIDNYAMDHDLEPINVVKEAPTDLPNTVEDESEYSASYDPANRELRLHPDLFGNTEDGRSPDAALDAAAHELVHAEAHDTFPGDPFWDTDEGHDLQEELADEFGEAVASDLKTECNPPPQSPAQQDDLGDDDLEDGEEEEEEGEKEKERKPPNRNPPNSSTVDYPNEGGPLP